MTDAKVIVIGSGAGGAPAAATLAAALGDGVLLVEAGAYNRDFNQLEADLVPRLYAGGGTQATEDGSVAFLQGVGVGGSTVINDGICFTPPPELAERWSACGAELGDISAEVAQVEAALSVEQIPKAKINRANYLVGLGAARLGWRGERLRHNSPSCVECGFRHIGCAYNAKQSMNLSYVPRALSAGARLMADTRVNRLRRESGRWILESSQGELSAEKVVLAAGVVQTPTLLLRSGFPAGEGVQVHLEAVAWGEFPDPVDAFAGIPMSYGVLEFADVYGQRGPGYLMEGVGVQPMAFSVHPQLQGPAYEAVLARYRHMAGVVSLLRSRARGRVSLRGDRPRIDYPFIPEDTDRLRHFFGKAVELMRAAGAERVLLPHREVGWVSAPVDDLRIEPGLLYLYTAHPFGGANRGGVCDAVGRVKGQEDLWVLDASAFPEALGVNPQITIAAVAIQGAGRILAG